MDYREIVEQATKEGKTVEQVAKERQKKQADASGALTKDFTAAQMAVANSSKNIQKLGFIFLNSYASSRHNSADAFCVFKVSATTIKCFLLML